MVLRFANTLAQPGFMRTEMTKGVGFDQFWDDGGGKDASRQSPYEPTILMDLLLSCHSGRGRRVSH